MKRLTYSSDIDEAENIARTLESAGIAVHLGNWKSRRWGGIYLSTSRVDVFVIDDSQLSDAQKVLEDPSYRVRRPFSEKQLQMLKTEMRARSLTAMSKWAVVLLVIVVGIVALAIALWRSQVAA